MADPAPTSSSPSLTFGDLRLASRLHKTMAADAFAGLAELARSVVPTGTLERFLDGKAIDAQTRLIRQSGKLGLVAQTLADMVIQIDRFAALNDIDLAQAIRDRFAVQGIDQAKEDHDDLERQRPGA